MLDRSLVLGIYQDIFTEFFVDQELRLKREEISFLEYDRPLHQLEVYDSKVLNDP